jgi:hypothetical protein
MRIGSYVRFKGSHFNKWADSGDEPFSTTEKLTLIEWLPERKRATVSYMNKPNYFWSLSPEALEPFKPLNLPDWW